MKSEINNEFYHDLGEGWYQDDKHAIALLRAEQKAKNTWVKAVIQKNKGKEANILDIACGGGFLSNYLAKSFDHITGVDASESSLEIAKKYDSTNRVTYKIADAYKLPFEDNSFDIVCLMDFLEHVDRPEDVIKEASRVLRANGLLFYHTFNRNFLSWLIVIQAVDWLVPNAPKNLHVHHLFIKPNELQSMLATNKLKNLETLGLRPKFNKYFFKSIIKRKILKEFDFTITNDLKLGYIGYARKQD